MLTPPLTDQRVVRHPNQKLISFTTSHILYTILSCSEPFSSENYMWRSICTMQWHRIRRIRCIYTCKTEHKLLSKNFNRSIINKKSSFYSTYICRTTLRCGKYATNKSTWNCKLLTFCWRKNQVTVGLMRCPFFPLTRIFKSVSGTSLSKDLPLSSFFIVFFWKLRKYFQTDGQLNRNNLSFIARPPGLPGHGGGMK